MANLYVRSTDGSDADNGTTWALAKATLSGAAAIDAAGDVIYLSQNHAESGASSSCAFAGTNANPVRIIGGNDAAEPPTSLSSAPTVTVTGTTCLVNGGVYVYGVNWVFTSTSSFSPTFNSSNGFFEVYDTCKFFYTGAAGSPVIGFGSGGGGAHGITELRNCQFKLGGSGHRIQADHDLYIYGGSWASGGTNPTGIFTMSSTRPTNLLIDGFDFTNLSTTFNIIQSTTEGSCNAIIRNCKLPASWTGGPLASGQAKLGSRICMYNSDNGDTNYRVWIEDYGGTIRDETTIVRSGGASDGTTPISWKMSTSANTAYPTSVLYSDWISQWNETTGSSLTATVEIVHDTNVAAGQGAGTSSRFQDNEIWLEVFYSNDASFPLYASATDKPANILTAAADQTDSSVTWTTTGLTTPVKQKISVPFTAQNKGVVYARVCMAKASKVCYVDPKVTIA